MDPINARILDRFQDGKLKGTWSPQGCLAETIAILDEVTAEGKELDPAEEAQRSRLSNIYGRWAKEFHDRGYWAAATGLLLDGWEKLSARQQMTGEKIYLAGLAIDLSAQYTRMYDAGAATRWALLTHADDLLISGGTVSGQANNWLRSAVGIGGSALSRFEEAAMECLSNVKPPCDWASADGFPQHVLFRFAIGNPEAVEFFDAPTNVDEYPASPAYFGPLLTAVDAAATNTTAQGATLEDLMSAMFLLIPGWVPIRNVSPWDAASEHDLIVRNTSRGTDVRADLLGRHFLVECKNWESSVGVGQIGYFLYRMHLTHSHFGIMVAKNGITGKGSSEEKSARGLIRRAFHEDGTICVVLTMEDLARIGRGQAKLWPTLLRAIEQTRFGTAASQTSQLALIGK